MRAERFNEPRDLSAPECTKLQGISTTEKPAHSTSMVIATSRAYRFRKGIAALSASRVMHLW